MNVVSVISGVKQGAEIEAQDNRGWTALFHATFSGHQNMVKFLLDNDADMNAQSLYVLCFSALNS